MNGKFLLKFFYLKFSFELTKKYLVFLILINGLNFLVKVAFNNLVKSNLHFERLISYNLFRSDEVYSFFDHLNLVFFF